MKAGTWPHVHWDLTGARKGISVAWMPFLTLSTSDG